MHRFWKICHVSASRLARVNTHYFGVVVLVFSLLFSFSTHAAEGTDAPLDTANELRVLISDRLSLMPAVAKYKWNRGIPVEDLARERIILGRLVTQAQEAGVEPAFAERFFKDQITAAKAIQHGLIAAWRAEGRPPFEDVPDLREELRPKLDRLTKRLLMSLAKLNDYSDKKRFAAAINRVPPMWEAQPDVWKTAVNALSPPFQK